ncbi:molybdate ABC transporter substrate-binding protein [Arthrobacter sp. Sa2CUA1]|uniref:Molybdate ABC transporter substrate-binding protein n=1 Tax=Arthrobacter gallicola TaxID=2762225 RepID=A0ABR8UNP7_9MICC|nr:molybdate ABC transporter substrate-binding protein [Arthrobacter gallicola]MBD7993992.1 molybdate ABC transporter substrate-binding protein [Arthrobacter gallicola]
MLHGNSLHTSLRTIALSVGAVVLLAGCAGNPPSSSGPEPAGEMMVFAAASLSGPFTDLAEEFEADHPGTTVRLNFAGSADLATQIQSGAPADVFASADGTNMDKVAGSGLAAGDPVPFAVNTLTIAVPPGNPAGITGFNDLGEPGRQVVMCAEQVPCGAAAARIEAATGTEITPVSEETSVTGVLGKVASGEADAGLVYVTDVLASAGSVEEVAFPEAAQAVNTYPIVRLTNARQPELADDFISFVHSGPGQDILRKAGFGAP